MAKLRFGELEAAIDAGDVQFQKTLEQAAHAFLDTLHALEEDPKTGSECVIGYCEAVFSLFNTLFGEGTDKKMFGTRANVKTCNDALLALARAMARANRACVKHMRASAQAIGRAAEEGR